MLTAKQIALKTVSGEYRDLSGHSILTNTEKDIESLISQVNKENETFILELRTNLTRLGRGVTVNNIIEMIDEKLKSQKDV